jgi:hypothetical protein
MGWLEDDKEGEALYTLTLYVIGAYLGVLSHKIQRHKFANCFSH